MLEVIGISDWVIVCAIGLVILTAVSLWISDSNTNGRIIGNNFSIVESVQFDPITNHTSHISYTGYNNTRFYRMFGPNTCKGITSDCVTREQCKDKIVALFRQSTIKRGEVGTLTLV